MNGKKERRDKGVLNQVRAVARRAREERSPLVLPPPPAELRHTPNALILIELAKEEARLREEIQHQEVLTQDHPTNGNHLADDASEVFEQTKNLAIKRHLESMLEQVEQAIRQIRRGKYGTCDKCGGSIDPERLRVLPEATLCVRCAGAGRNPHLAPHVT